MDPLGATKPEGLAASLGSVPRPSFETFITRLFRDGVQFCSGLVDLVVCVFGHGGGGHRLALAGERFVGLVAEDFAQVLADGPLEVRHSRLLQV
jgi:hypothetical protein